MAAKDVWGEIMGTIDTEEKFEQYRWEMANRVWARMEATDSRECRECHSYEAMDFHRQSRSARAKMKRALKRKETCIQCHKGLVHNLPEGWEDV